MPTYEFRCPDGTIIERVFKMSDVPDAIPVPNGTGMAVRIISGGADLIFKGSGFYITDYGKDGKKDQREAKPDAKRDDKTSADASDKAPKSADAKAAPATANEKSGDTKPSKSEPKSKPPTPPSGAAA